MKKFVAALLFVLPLLAYSKINPSIDWASFRGMEGKSIWEFYFSFPDTTLWYSMNEDIHSAEINMKLEIFDAGRKLTTDEWVLNHSVTGNNMEQNDYQNIYGIRKYMVPAGQYKAEFTIEDKNNPENTSKSVIDFIVPHLDADKVFLSEFQLAAVIQKENENTENWNKEFYKNTYFVIPNPSREISGSSPVMRYYMEIYNAEKYSPGGIKMRYYVYDPVGNEKTFFERKKNSAGDGLLDIVEFPMDLFPTGTYIMKATVVFPADNPVDSTSVQKKFFLYNSEIKPEYRAQFTESQRYSMSSFASLPDTLIAEEIEMAKIIASHEERLQIEALSDLKGKRRFLFTFWDKRDPDTTTQINEKLLEFRERVRFADNFFSWGNVKDGWETERGEIFIRYGMPDERAETLATAETRAYEEWFYTEIRGGVRFYFVDRMGSGDMRLVHSTLTGYIYNPNWYDENVPVYKSWDDSNPQRW